MDRTTKNILFTVIGAILITFGFLYRDKNKTVSNISIGIGIGVIVLLIISIIFISDENYIKTYSFKDGILKGRNYKWKGEIIKFDYKKGNRYIFKDIDNKNIELVKQDFV